MDKITKSGKTVDDALHEALKELNASKDEVEVTVIDEGIKGFLGMFGAKDAVIQVVRKFNPEKIAVTFLNEMFQAMHMNVSIETKLKEKLAKKPEQVIELAVKGKQLSIELSGDEIGILIGKRGQTLDSIQYLVSLVVNKGNSPYISILLDTENYRQRRKETLESLAYNLAKKVKQTKRNVVLEPMNPYERRIIHSSLQNDRYVTTYSEGEEPYRNVVITLKS